MVKYGFTFVVFLMSLYTNGQLLIQNIQTPEELVTGVLIGNGVVATNIKYNGVPLSASSVQTNITFFDANGTSFPIQKGILLSTGNGAMVAPGPNTSAGSGNSQGTSLIVEPDLSQASSSDELKNGLFLEFDFVATGSSFSFNYIFASEEYPEYAPPNSSSYNDAFGFFLSGPGISGPYSNEGINIAVLPTTNSSTNVVSINNVNPSVNSSYFVDNSNGIAYGNAIQYDGTTTLLEAKSSLICGETYHIKLSIANVGDQQYDSGVFLQANSFSSTSVDLGILPSSINGQVIDGTLLEGCPNALSQMILTRPLDQISTTMDVEFTYTGSATYGIDYSSLPTTVNFPVGEDSVVIDLQAFIDGQTEAPESIIITTSFVNNCGDTIQVADTVFITNISNLKITATDYVLYCDQSDFMTDAVVTGGFQPYVFNWDNGNTTANILIDGSPVQAANYILTSNDMCGNIAKDTISVTVQQIQAMFEPDITSGYVPSNVLFENQSLNATNFFWDFGNTETESVNDMSSQSVIYATEGEYTIELIAYNGLCTDTVYRTIKLTIKPSIEIPTAFTPDGDYTNDTWELENIDNFYPNNQVTIYNRWGSMIFQSPVGQYESNAWNGKYNNESLPVGSYYFIIDYDSTMPSLCTGTVTIVLNEK